MNELDVALVWSARPWRAALQRHGRDHEAGVAIRVVRDFRAAVEERGDALVLDDETSFASPTLVAALRERGTRVVGVYDPADPEGEGRVALGRLGLDAVVPADVAPEALVATLRELCPDDGLASRFDEVVADLEPAVVAGGRCVAVGGPPGAGATEIAVGTAAALARLGRTVLVDVDEVAAPVARRLALGLHPQVLAALDGLHGGRLRVVDEPGGDPLEAALARPVAGRAAPPFDVVAGLADGGDWALLRPDDVRYLLAEAAARWDWVVVNLGPSLEDLSRYVDRHGASRAALGEADVVVGVAEASRRGLLRFLDWAASVTVRARLAGSASAKMPGRPGGGAGRPSS